MDVYDNNIINGLSEVSKTNGRLRATHLIHHSAEEKCQRMLTVLQPGTPMPTHSHPIDETIFVVQGELTLIKTNAEGQPIERHTLNPLKGAYGVRINPGEFHTLTVSLPDTVILEVKDGPYLP